MPAKDVLFSVRAVIASALLVSGLTVAASVPATASPPGPQPAQQPAHEPGTGLRFTSPTGHVLRGTVDLTVTAPDATTAVRFYLDGIRVSELTDLYFTQTKTAPVWSTATDVGWFAPGPHVLRAEADTPAGQLDTSEHVVTTRPRSPRGITPLNGGWDFAPSADLPAGSLDGDAPAAIQPGYRSGGWTSIVVPDSFGAVANKWNDDNGLQVAYRRTVELPRSTTTQRTALRFDSCYWSCRYFVNGEQVGTSRGGYLPTRLDVTAAVHPGTNTVAAIVDNRKSTMGVYATVHNYYWNWGGLLQQVQLEQTPQVALTEFRAEAAADGTLAVYPTAVNGTGTDQQVTARLRVTDAHGRDAMPSRLITVTVPADGEPAPTTVTVPQPKLWDLDHPTLYTVHLDPIGRASWRGLTEQTGFRTVSVDGADLMLNGKPVEDLQGFDRHTDYPGLGRTQPDGLADREIKFLHDKGMQIFRPAHYPTTPAELAAADKYGLLVIEEINVTGFSGASLATSDVQDYAKSQLTKEIARDRSHPSVFAFSVGNENRTDQDGARSYVAAVIGLGRQLDPKRLYLQVTLAGIASSSHGLDKTLDLQDFVAQNYYAGAGDGNAYPVLPMIEGLRKLSGNKPVLLSEYGVEGVLGRQGTGVGTEFFQAGLIDEHNRLLNKLPHFIGKMYWTSTEFWCTPNWSGGNPQPVPPFHTKALISYDRKPKLGWKVIFSPIRIWASALDATPGVKQTLHERVRIEDVRGHGASGTLTVTPPHGYTASRTSERFHIAPNGVQTVDVTLTGTLPRSGSVDPGMVHAIINSDTEAMPRLLSVLPNDGTVHQAASDDFSSSTLDSGWNVVRPDASGWSLTDPPGSLRLTAEAGTEEGSGSTAPNLFVRTSTPAVDYTAQTHLQAATDTDGQDASLYAYRDDDDFVKVGIAEMNGARVIRFAQEAGGAINYSDTRPLVADNAWVRLVRRGSSYTADYSYDGQTWYSFTSRRAVAGTVRLALQAQAGTGAGAKAIPTYADGLTVLTSGALTLGTVSAGSAPILSGKPTPVQVTLVNGSDHAVPVTATLDVPAGWSAGTATATIPAFSTASVPVPVTSPVIPETVTATAVVTATGVDVNGAASGQLTSVPSGSDVPLALDAGCPTSPVLPTYRGLNPTSIWSASAGYGWVGAVPTCRDRAKLDALRRDFVNSLTPSTLRVPVPAGTHDIYLLIGDPGYAVKNMTVSIGDKVVAESGDVAAGQAKWIHFGVDGGSAGNSVDLTFTATPTEYWSFDALVVMPSGAGS